MAKLKNREPEGCVYRHCTNEFRPKREAQRFCSPRCREAYRYDQKLLIQGGRERLEARKRHLGPGTPRSAEKTGKRSTETIGYREGIGPSIALKSGLPAVVDLVGIDLKLLRKIIEIECSLNGK